MNRPLELALCTLLAGQTVPHMEQELRMTRDVTASINALLRNPKMREFQRIDPFPEEHFKAETVPSAPEPFDDP